MINLDKGGYFTFSGEEVHVKYDEFSEGQRRTILMKDYSMNGLMALAELCEIAYRHKTKIDVIYPYFPYARQDRVMNTDEPFSLRIFCKFLNSLSLASVTVVDPHSDVVSALVHDVKVIPQWEVAKQVIPKEYFMRKNMLWVSPDAGAYKKVSKLISDDKKIVVGVKERDSKGKIISTNVYSPVDITGKECIMVDDICDGGRTFIELAKVLKAKGADKIYLYVTHGIFSQGFGEINTYIDHVYTTDSFINKAPNKLVTVKEIKYG